MKRVPEGHVSLEATAIVNPSEDEGKVLQAITTVLPTSIFGREGEKIIARSNDPESLRNVREQMVRRRILGVANRLLERNRSPEETWIMFNKQAACAGVIAVCEEDGDSPLGPIMLTIRTEKLDEFISWLAPL